MAIAVLLFPIKNSTNGDKYERQEEEKENSLQQKF